MVESVPLLPAVVLVVLWMIWISASGGYYQDAWYPSTLAVLALAAVTTLLGGRRAPSSRAARVALAAFAALVAFNYLSILWSASSGSALQASNELVLYLAVAWTFAILPWTPRTVAALLGAWAIGIAVFCAVGLLQSTSAPSSNPFFVGTLRDAVGLPERDRRPGGDGYVASADPFHTAGVADLAAGGVSFDCRVPRRVLASPTKPGRIARARPHDPACVARRVDRLRLLSRLRSTWH